MAKEVKNTGKSDIPEEKDNTPMETIDGIIKAFYDAVSFTSGRQPDFKQLRNLFHPQGQLVPPRRDKESAIDVLLLDDYAKQAVEHIVLTGIERKGMITTEIARRTQSFGSIVHILSTFEVQYAIGESTPVHRGIYSIQLFRDRHRWWIHSVMWEHERPGTPLPRAFLV
jgi:hypothetical protein